MPFLFVTEMSEYKLIVFGSNASMRMGGEAQKPLRFYDAYKQHGWSPTLVVHERNFEELEQLYPCRKEHNIHVLKDTLFQISTYKLHGMSQRFFPFLSPFFGMLIWMSSQAQMKKNLPQICGDRKAVVHIANPISLFAPIVSLPKSMTFIGPLALGPGSSISADRWATKSAFAIKVATGRVLNAMFSGKRHATAIFCDGEHALKVGKRVFGSRPVIHKIPHNGVLDNWFDIERVAEAGEKRILYVGRLDSWKGVNFLIRAVKQLPDDVVLEIIGDGPIRQSLIQEAGSDFGRKIIFTPWLDHVELGMRYARAAVFVAPSYAETGGTSVKEAMAAGIPVVATSWGGHIERLPPDCGELVAPPRQHGEERFPRELARAISSILDDQPAAEARAQRARQYVYDKYRWQNIGMAAISVINTELETSNKSAP